MAGALGGRAAHPAVTGRVLLCAVLAGCGAGRLPSTLRGYDILVERRDPQGTELAGALRDAGFRVRRGVRGGSRPTAALIFFTFSEPGRGQSDWLHLRLADTRTGAIIAAVAIPLDSVAPNPRARAVAAVHALISP